MRMTQLFSRTTYATGDPEGVSSSELLVRAGFIRQLAAGIYSNMPLAHRSLGKIMNILREEMNAIGGQELSMPVVHPAELWQQTGRWYQIGSELGRFKDKHERDMVLAMTHEEVVASLVKSDISSYRHLPVLIYHLQTKWRDDPRPRAGLIRVREFIMKDSYSLDRDNEGLDLQYEAHYQAYFNIFNRAKLPALAVKSDTGMMGGQMAHEYMYLTPIGEDTLLICDNCNYSANQQIATFQKPANPPEEPKPLEKVETPDTKTIATLAEFLKVPKSKTAKAVFLVGTFEDEQTKIESDKLVFAIVRGDMDLCETKLTNALGSKALRPATEAEISAVGAVPGYASPIGIRGTVITAVDDAVKTSPNLVAGANEAGYHLLHTNLERDYQADIVTDIAEAREGDSCPNCGAALTARRGVEIGNIFKLGTRYTEAMGATYLDETGRARPVVMGSYGIGVGRMLACIAEEHHDDNGLIWPITVAPYEVHLVVLPHKKDPEPAQKAEEIYTQLKYAGVDILFDDRDESAGVKFNDSDLIGIPVRLTVSSRSLKEGGVELKLRHESDKRMVPLADLEAEVRRVITQLYTEIEAEITIVPFEE